MTTALHDDAFSTWIGRDTPKTRKHARRRPPEGLRFAFYGRASTIEHQDPATSEGWQREAAEHLVAGHGRIVASYFDVGSSRRLPWRHRPQAAELLAALANPDRGFDAIVVGEYERAFAADQFQRMAPLFRRHGIQIWLPEANGPLDPGSVMHQALMTVLGAQSHREVLRARHRALAAMRIQVANQGRYLGGRPPYGYQLVDAGPHPNQADAKWGRRLRRLAEDPETARHVRWMFTERRSGRSVAGIARALNEKNVPCPSTVDPARNAHRSGVLWTVRSVATILENPRYTGWQVWNRHSADHDASTDRRRVVHQRTIRQDWVVSKQRTHTALVSEPDFVAVQGMRSARPTSDGSIRTYQLSGLLRCGVCDRRMDSHWVHGNAGYRCRHGHSSSRTRMPDTPRPLYLREEVLLARIGTHLSGDDHEARPQSAEIATFLHVNASTVICYTDHVTIRNQA
jgi:site-specific DNA recombinase